MFRNAATKSEAQKLMLQWKMNVKKPGKDSIVNFFIRAATKKGELFINIRSSRPAVFCKKVFLEISQIHRKTPVSEFFF